MVWVWTDEIAEVLRGSEGVDSALLRRWSAAPVAIHADPDETIEGIALRLGVVPDRAHNEEPASE
jgi:hypothetical protein